MSDDPNRPLTPGERAALERAQEKERLKEQYKEELRAKKQFLRQTDELRRSTSAAQAVSAVENLEAQTQALMDDTDLWIAKLSQTSALAEAKLEIALDSAVSDSASAESPLSPTLDDDDYNALLPRRSQSETDVPPAGETSDSKPAKPLGDL